MEFLHVTENEADEVLRLYRSLLGTPYCIWNENYPTEKEIKSDLSRKALFCIKEKNEIIGVISIDDDAEVQALDCWSKTLEPSAELSRVGIARLWQNQGIARMLLENAMEELKRQGYKGIHLLVAKENEKALRSYRKLDFHVVGEHELWGHEYWCYEKEL